MLGKLDQSTQVNRMASISQFDFYSQIEQGVFLFAFCVKQPDEFFFEEFHGNSFVTRSKIPFMYASAIP